jgi:hypothetical protein
MGFHSQTFSDKSFHTHWALTPSLFILEKPKGVVSEFPMRFQFLGKPISHDHFREKNRKINYDSLYEMIRNNLNDLGDFSKTIVALL